MDKGQPTEPNIPAAVEKIKNDLLEESKRVRQAVRGPSLIKKSKKAIAMSYAFKALGTSSAVETVRIAEEMEQALKD